MDLPVALRHSGAILVLLLTPFLGAQAAIGRTPGFASVSQGGEAEYTIPISLPSGTNGMTPVLALEYRHRTKAGLLGIGWSIGGLSQIARCARTIAQDGIASPAGLTVADRFCLDGQRLVIVNNVIYETPGAEYRTEIESYARVRSYPGATNGPDYFVVEAADGRTYEYGATGDSRIDGRPATTSVGARTWALNRMRDRSGNVIDYRYVEDPTGGSFRIASIHYNSNPAAGIAASHQVSFSYENRPNSEVDTGYVAGMPVRQVVRLDRIDVIYNGAALRRYEIDYEPALSAGGRSRLASVRECMGTGPDCFAPTTFKWRDATPGFAAPIAMTAAIPSSTPFPDVSAAIDINGDGRLDYAWAGGATISAATIRYRLGLGNGAFGPEINSGIACPYGIGKPFDSNGDGRADLLMHTPGLRFAIVVGSDTGLRLASTTSFTTPNLMVGYRGLDLNGDGLGDIAYGETDPTYSSLFVRARYAQAAGGFSAPVTLYSQEESAGYTGYQGGEYLGRPGRVDLNGDGAEDLLMNENVAVVGISQNGHGTAFFDSPFAGGIVFDFNDDSCSDFAYRHVTGTLRLRVAGCGTSLSHVELLGPAWNGGSALHAHDWNADGREDILLRGPTNWHVAISNGDSLSPIVDTGMPHEGVAAITGMDVNGDGLQDLVTRAGAQVSVRLRKGATPDLLVSAKDGFGVLAEFEYKPLTDATVHQRSASAVYPERDWQPAAQVVTKLVTTDGSGRGSRSSTGYRYEGLRHHLLGRGSLGFRKQVRIDLTSSPLLNTEITLRQDFPYTGLPESVVLRQPSGKPVTVATWQWSKIDVGTITSLRRYPYAASVTSRRYEAGGPLDGTEISRTTRTVAAIDSASGLVTDETTTVTEIAGGANAGSSATFRSQHTNVLNDFTNWCLGKPQSIQLTASHSLPGGTSIARESSLAWDGPKCRPTRHTLEPASSQWKVTRDLAYDAFGNLASEKVTGAGMTARTMSIAWGTRGQLPIHIGNPLSELTRFTWDEARGLPLTMTDANGSVMRWSYDAFGRPMQEIQPDGTRTNWMLESCKTGCDSRAKYRIVQEDRDNAGTVRVVSRVEVDQNGRGFRQESQRFGGGTAILSFELDRFGRLRRQDLPHWEGELAPGYWSQSYDLLGRPTATQLFSRANAVERSTTIQFEGHSATATDSLGHSTTGIRSAWGQLSEVVDALGGRTRYEYDAFGNVVGIQDARNNAIATVGYNPRGMKLTQADSDAGTWTWTRNALGETTTLRDAKGQVTRFEYDLLGRLAKRVAPDGTATWNWGKTASSKNIGRLAGVAGTGYAENFTYDGIGRPATRTIITDASYRYDYAYNPLGLLDTIGYPAAGAGSPFKIRHDYDSGRVSRIRNADSPGETYWSLNAEDAAGSRLDESLGSAIRVVYGFAPVSGMLEYRQGTAGGVRFQDLAYAWDANGNLLRREDINRGLAEEFRYDSLDRLDESRMNGILNLEVDYDATGNILRKSDVCPTTAACYTYHATRKHAVTAAGGVSYAYDANGNMTTNGGATIGWTSDNRPSSIAHSNGNYSQFSYGPDGNRWKQAAKHGSATETTIYAGELLEKATRAGATKWRHYVATPGGYSVIHLRHSDGTQPAMHYLAKDHLDSIDGILDSAGNVVVAESFGAFGSRRSTSWTGIPTATDLVKIGSTTRDGFTSHEHLNNLHLIHMNGRVYDPRLARFISPDPYVTLPYDGQGLNRYAYVLNNPLSFTDPSGFDPPPCVESAAGNCAQVTVVGVQWADWIRYLSGGAAQAASARERDPCGQDSDAYTCAMQGARLASPSSIVLTVGTQADSTLARSRGLDGVQGFAARIGNLVISSSPIALLFNADPDFEYFDEPGSDAGRAGAQAGNVGYFIGGAAGVIRKGASQVAAGAPSQVARTFQGNPKYPGIDRFKDITLKKGTIVYSGFPGQTAFYTTASALRRSGSSASALFQGLQLKRHDRLGFRTRVAAYEVMADTPAAFGLAIANMDHGTGWLPQVVVPSFQTSLRFVDELPLNP